KTEVSYGDVVTYEVVIQNNNLFSVTNVSLVDIIPAGFKYVEDSGVIVSGTQTTKVTPASLSSGTTKRFDPITLTARSSITYRYQLVVSAGVVFGDYTNIARAENISGTTRTILSHNVKVKVLVVPDALFDYATVIGKVFNDVNGNGIQDEGEIGIAGVKITTEDGIVIITDRDGKYHLAGIRPATRLLKVDPASLPLNTRFTTQDSVVVRFTAGGRLEKVNFGVRLIQEKVESASKITVEVTVKDGVPSVKIGGEAVKLNWGPKPRTPAIADVWVRIQEQEMPIPSEGEITKREITLPQVDTTLKVWVRDNRGREIETEYRVRVPKLDVTVKRDTDVPMLVPELGIALTPEIMEIRQGRLVRSAKFKIITNYAGFIEKWRLQILEPETVPKSGEPEARLTEPVGQAPQSLSDVSPAGAGARRATATETTPTTYRLFKEFSGTRENIEEVIIWDGKGDDGRLVRLDTPYRYLLTLIDAEGREDQSVEGQLVAQSQWAEAIRVSLGIKRIDKPALLPIPASGFEKDKKQIPVSGQLYQITGITDPTSKVIVSTPKAYNIVTVKPYEDGKFEAEVYLDIAVEEIIVETISKDGLRRRFLTSDIRPEEVKEKYFYYTALADLMLGSNSREGDEAMLDAFAKNDLRYKEGIYAQGRLSGFLKMKTKEWTITGSIDSDRVGPQSSKYLFRYLDPDKFYPFYGDSSTRIDEAFNTQGPLYVRAEHIQGYKALLGNYQTNLSGGELAQYSRSLYGLQLGYNTPAPGKEVVTPQQHKTDATFFISSATQMASHDEIRATGGSLYYFKNKGVRQGSEKLTIETRDKISGIVTQAITLKVNEDYEIDYSGGRIILNKPLASVSTSTTLISNDLLEGNPVYLVVDYEYEPENWWNFRKEVMGTRVVHSMKELGPMSNLTIGVTYVKEEKDLTDYTLIGTDLSAKIGKFIDTRVEFAQSESEGISGYLSDNGGFDFASLATSSKADGSSYKLSLSMDIGAVMYNKPGEISGKAYLANVESGYSSGSTISQQGTQKMGLEVGARLTENDTFLTRVDSQKVLQGGNAASQSQAGATETFTLLMNLAHRQDPVRLSAEFRYQDTLTPYVMPGLLRDASSMMLAARAEYDYHKNLSLFAEEQLALDGKPNNQTTIGANLKLSDKLTGNIQQTMGTLGNSTIFGVTTAVGESTEKRSLYTSYQIAQDASGAQSHNIVIGEKETISPKLSIYRENRFSQRRGAEDGNLSNVFGTNYTIAQTQNWLLNASYERSQIDRLGATSQSRDAFATEAVYNSHPQEKDKTRIMGYLNGVIRFEARSEKAAQERTSYLTANRLFYQLNEDLNLTAKCYLSETKSETGIHSRFIEVGSAFAYRPTKYDKYNFIGKFNYLEEQGTPAQARPQGMTTNTKAIVFALEGGVDVTRSLQIVEKVAYRNNIETVTGLPELDKDVSMLALRLNYRLFSSLKPLDKWIVGLEYRLLNVALSEDSRTGGVFEIERPVGDNLMLGFGYNFVDFSDDLTQLSRNYKIQGAFIRLTAKY
ncbi:MAG: SdrD B-like domain-containing protein, partial [Planctomycetota bacterium]|nr:SdrD B-like domain-containing protein [Planctomycetota bacterium]